MTQDEIIRMAREAGFSEAIQLQCVNKFERFAALVAAHVINRVIPAAVGDTAEAVLAEREACAKVCDEMYEPDESDYHWIPDGRGALKSAAAAIRARGESRGSDE